MERQQEITIEIQNPRLTLLELIEMAAHQFAKDISTYDHNYEQYCRVDVKHLDTLVQLDAESKPYMEARFLCTLM